MVASGKAMLDGGERTRVVWLGRSSPSGLNEVGDVLGLTIEFAKDAVDVSMQDLFAVLVCADGSDSRKAQVRLAKLLSQNALDYGVLICVVSVDLSVSNNLQTQMLTWANH